MISYREKQLLMVQKFLQDRNEVFATQLENLVSCIQNEKGINDFDLLHTLPDISDFNELVEYVESQGYDTWVRVEDILSKEELEQLDAEYEKIKNDFAEITKLKKADIGFLIGAILLQVIRQILQPKLDFKNLNNENRDTADKTAKETNKDNYKDKIDKQKEKEDNTSDNEKKYYYASFAQIADLSHVPYDVIAGTKDMGLGLSPKNHRQNTLGHDPWLGYFFGTCNILTNTMTLGGKEHLFSSYHVRNGKVTENADISKIIKYSYARFQKSKPTVAVALIKQAYHIQSDIKSKQGLPIPMLELLCSSETIEKLCEKGLDYNNLVFLKTVATQAELTILIDFIIGISHTLFMWFKEDLPKSKITENSNIEDCETALNSLISNENIKKIRTRKVLMYSNLIAESVNIIYTAIGVVCGVVAENPEQIKKSLEKLDVGGIIVALVHLFADTRFITKIKKDFIANTLKEDFQQKLKEFDAICCEE